MNGRDPTTLDRESTSTDPAVEAISLASDQGTSMRDLAAWALMTTCASALLAGTAVSAGMPGVTGIEVFASLIGILNIPTGVILLSISWRALTSAEWNGRR